MPAGGNLLISDLVCPAPPTHGRWISKETLGGLIVPKPNCENETQFNIIILLYHSSIQWMTSHELIVWRILQQKMMYQNSQEDVSQTL